MHETTTSPLQPYVYDALPQGDVFRYLTLHSGDYEDALKCSLHVTVIDGAPPYEAISYVWGTDDLDHPISCDDKVLLITPNLSKVLRRLRLRNAPRTLWADSICINQRDLEEKGHQVAIMSKIYQSATRVLIYMGEDHGGLGSHVQTLVEEVTSMIEDELEKIHTPTWNSFPYHENMPFVNDTRWNSLGTLLKQAWFSRGWVVREAALAQQGRIIWGQSEFDWTQLMLTLIWREARGWAVVAQDRNLSSLAQIHMDAYADRYIRKVQCLCEISDLKKRHVLDYLATGRKLRMSNPRDRLYAFLDISNEEGSQIQVEPKYDDTVLKVYHKFARQYIDVIKDLRILEYIGHDSQSLQSSIPSWVPNWDYRESEPYQNRTGYCTTSRAGIIYDPILVGENLLGVRGVILEPIRFVSSVFDGPTTTIKTLAGVWAAVRLCDSTNPYPSSYSTRDFVSTLTEVLEGICNSSEGRTDEESYLETSVVHAWIKTCLDGKKFMLTERGYMGLSPAVAQEGDMCGIIFGCSMPCILRKTEQSNRYRFIGRCFALGNQTYETLDGYTSCVYTLGSTNSKEWVDWDVEEQDIYLC